ncbi:transcriptional regulator [Corynebacterium deserti GIMN1.010]|uniref:Transcriptional regulator n=1 Tax=Corynebacterium deserti GIMN1.010 TaxID=931089 RepID=A0A0M4CGE1_9CORY|nr:metalloregulator ArsR/SmtB family transcription factor [Corynebacterium deserti]ALC06027.1 transcriptional regulator [Corynebacterium deserti GIMN1.010]
MENQEHLMSLATDWAPVFKLMGDRTRLRLLLAMHYFGPGEATVSELADIVGVTLPTASAALQVLAEGGVVEPVKEGRVTRYKLVDATTHALLHHVGGIHRH